MCHKPFVALTNVFFLLSDVGVNLVHLSAQSGQPEARTFICEYVHKTDGQSCASTWSHWD